MALDFGRSLLLVLQFALEVVISASFRVRKMGGGIVMCLSPGMHPPRRPFPALIEPHAWAKLTRAKNWPLRRKNYYWYIGGRTEMALWRGLMTEKGRNGVFSEVGFFYRTDLGDFRDFRAGRNPPKRGDFGSNL